MTDNPSAASRNPHPERFNVVSLGAWIPLCETVSLPFVPAEPVASIDIRLLMNWDVEQGPALREFFTTIERAKRPGTMLRWDCCAPSDVKARLAAGRPAWSPALTDHFTIDDARAFTIITEYPGDTMKVWRRPWMDAAVVDRYPVEYRVFVEAGTVIGISSYYPQRPLKQEDTLQDVFRLNIVAGTLIRGLAGKTIVHPPPGDRGPGGLSFTADFMRLRDGSLLFLEGGPAFGSGAHPCCFEHADDWTAAPTFTVNGVPVALEAQPSSAQIASQPHTRPVATEAPPMRRPDAAPAAIPLAGEAP